MSDRIFLISMGAIFAALGVSGVSMSGIGLALFPLSMGPLMIVVGIKDAG